nr:MAG TPA: hypothetical protein [Caudoviricetes sp.]
MGWGYVSSGLSAADMGAVPRLQRGLLQKIVRASNLRGLT